MLLDDSVASQTVLLLYFCWLHSARNERVKQALNSRDKRFEAALIVQINGELDLMRMEKYSRETHRRVCNTSSKNVM